MKEFAKGWLLAACLCLTPALRADDKKEEDAKKDKEPTTEQEFVHKALVGNTAEVKLGELAVKQAANEDVKKFGQKMIDDHTKARDELLQHAKTLKLDVGALADKEKLEKQEKLAALKGAEFDREYMKCMLEDHEKTMKMLETWSKKAQDKGLVEWITKTMPTVKQHHEMAKQIADKLKS